jgi:hypothetical protein
VALLEDGEWHDEKEVYQRLIPVVPTGIAVREQSDNQQRHYRTQKRTPQPQFRFRKGFDPVAIGARRFVRQAVFYQDCVERKGGRMKLKYKPRPAKFYPTPAPIDYSPQDMSQDTPQDTQQDAQRDTPDQQDA